MPDPYTQGSESITQAEHISPVKTGDNIQAKRVANYVWNGSEWERATPSSGGTSTPPKDSDRFGIQAVSEDATYKYYFFEADDADYYVMRKHLTNKVFSYTAGTGGYSTVYQSAILGPSGSPTWGDRGSIF